MLRAEFASQGDQLRGEQQAALDQLTAEHRRSLTSIRRRMNAIAKEVRAIQGAADDARARKAGWGAAELLPPVNGSAPQ